MAQTKVLSHDNQHIATVAKKRVAVTDTRL